MDAEKLSSIEWNKSDLKKFAESIGKKHEVEEAGNDVINRHQEKFFDSVRVKGELTDLEPKHSQLSKPYEYLVLKYGILLCLIKKTDLKTPFSDVQQEVIEWEKSISKKAESKEEVQSRPLRILSMSAAEYKNKITDEELNLIQRYIRHHNETSDTQTDKHNLQDFFLELAGEGKFPKVPKQAKEEHNRQDIKNAIYGLRNQGLVYIVKPEDTKIVGIPKEAEKTVREWLNIAMQEGNFRSMLTELADEDWISYDEIGDVQEKFLDGREGRSYEDKIDTLVEHDIHPADVLQETLDKEEAKNIIREYNLKEIMREKINLRKSKEVLIDHIIRFFEVTGDDEGRDDWELFLDSFYGISTFDPDRISGRLLKRIDFDQGTKKALESLFEEATASLFKNVFEYDDVKLAGQSKGNSEVADGEIKIDGGWCLWDNKGKTDGEPYKITSDERRAFESYISSKRDPVRIFVIIAPDFDERTLKELNKVNKKPEYDAEFCLIKSDDFQRLTSFIKEQDESFRVPVDVFDNTEVLNVDDAIELLEDIN
jgi:hypothetical protein